MNYKKLNQEIVSFTILLFVAMFIAIASVVYIKIGFEKDNFVYMIGGAFFLCFSVYGDFVFVKRIAKVGLARRSGELILYDKVRSIEEISNRLKRSKTLVAGSILFLIDNEYIEGVRVEKDRIVLAKEEEQKQQERNALEIAKIVNKTNSKKFLNSAKCENCGATVVFNGEKAICPYCGNLLKAKSE